MIIFRLMILVIRMKCERINETISGNKTINVLLLEKEIPCLIISVEKNKKSHVKELHELICAQRIG